MPQNDRGKALKAMEATWNNMEKKEKLMWIKKAAEDQKRFEVGPRALWGQGLCSAGRAVGFSGAVTPPLIACVSVSRAGDRPSGWIHPPLCCLKVFTSEVGAGGGGEAYAEPVIGLTSSVSVPPPERTE